LRICLKSWKHMPRLHVAILMIFSDILHHSNVSCYVYPRSLRFLLVQYSISLPMAIFVEFLHFIGMNQALFLKR
ncbi:predicted protein, partial [Arabidopsis lyrata subsp. lyrata]